MLKINGLSEATAVSTKVRTGGNGKGGAVKKFVFLKIRAAIAVGVKVGEYMQIPHLIALLENAKELVIIEPAKETEAPHYKIKDENGKEQEFAHSTFWHNLKNMMLDTGFVKKSKINFRRESVDYEGVKLAISTGLATLKEVIANGILTEKEAREKGVV